MLYFLCIVRGAVKMSPEESALSSVSLKCWNSARVEQIFIDLDSWKFQQDSYNRTRGRLPQFYIEPYLPFRWLSARFRNYPSDTVSAVGTMKRIYLPGCCSHESYAFRYHERKKERATANAVTLCVDFLPS
jgi:hypothetical protein